MAATYKPENITYAPIPPHTLSHFQTIPWCAAVLANPALKPILAPSRTPKTPSTEDSLVAETLQTPSTIPYWQAFFRAPTEDAARTNTTGEIYVLLELGTGVDGHAGVAHGGVLATVLDEVMGALVYLHMREGWAAFTAEMKVGFRRVVRTPGVLGVRAWVERGEGRKLWVRAEGGEGEGAPAVVGEAVFVVVGGEGGSAKI
jgi:acyl-coenzyme A thioesterase THEM4